MLFNLWYFDSFVIHDFKSAIWWNVYFCCLEKNIFIGEQLGHYRFLSTCLSLQLTYSLNFFAMVSISVELKATTKTSLLINFWTWPCTGSVKYIICVSEKTDSWTFLGIIMPKAFWNNIFKHSCIGWRNSLWKMFF